MAAPDRVPQHTSPAPPAGAHPLDAWIDEMGYDYFVELAASTRRGVADGTIPTFTDMGLLLDHVNNRIFGRDPCVTWAALLTGRPSPMTS